MLDSNIFNAEFWAEFARCLHMSADSILKELRPAIEQVRTDLGARIDKLDDKLSTRIDQVETKVDNVARELTTFRRDTSGQLHEVRSSLLRIDEKITNHEDRLLKLERH